eukprot:gene5801-7214_t
MWSQDDELKKPLLNTTGNYRYQYVEGSSDNVDYEDGGSSSMKKNQRKCNDILFLILFLGVLIGMGIISGIAYTKGDPSTLIPSNQFSDFVKNNTESFVVSKLQDAVAMMRKDKDVLIYSAILAIVMAAVWLELLKIFTRFFIYFTLCVGVALVAGLGLCFVLLGRKESSTSTQIVGYCLMASIILLIFVILYLRKNIDLTCAMFTETCRGVQNSPSVFITTFVIVAAFLGFLAYWTSTFVYLFSIPGETIDFDPDTNSGCVSGDFPVHFNTKIRNLMYFMAFGFFWVTSFISAVFQHVVAGAVSHWYFSRNPTGTSAVGSSNAYVSLGRALTYSMGSLALGSLIIGFIKFMQFVLRICKNTNSANKLVVFVANCLSCILGCVEAIVRWINKFGYIYVAMHGYSFCSATRQCFDLVSRNMFSAIILDFIGSLVLILGKVCGAAACALFTTGILYAMGRQLNPITIGLSALFAYCIFNLFTHVVGMGSDTIFVCYLEDLETNGPDNLYISQDLHHLLQEKASEAQKKQGNQQQQQQKQ